MTKKKSKTAKKKAIEMMSISSSEKESKGKTKQKYNTLKGAARFNPDDNPNY